MVMGALQLVVWKLIGLAHLEILQQQVFVLIYAEMVERWILQLESEMMEIQMIMMAVILLEMKKWAGLVQEVLLQLLIHVLKMKYEVMGLCSTQQQDIVMMEILITMMDETQLVVLRQDGLVLLEIQQLQVYVQILEEME